MFTKHPSFIPDGLFNCSLLVIFESSSKSVNLVMRLSFHNSIFYLQGSGSEDEEKNEGVLRTKKLKPKGRKGRRISSARLEETCLCGYTTHISDKSLKTQN